METSVEDRAVHVEAGGTPSSLTFFRAGLTGAAATAASAIALLVGANTAQAACSITGGVAPNNQYTCSGASGGGVNAGNGNDTITVDNTSTNVGDVNGSAGDDVLFLLGGTFTMGQGPWGGAGADSIVVNGARSIGNTDVRAGTDPMLTNAVDNSSDTIVFISGQFRAIFTGNPSNTTTGDDLVLFRGGTLQEGVAGSIIADAGNDTVRASGGFINNSIATHGGDDVVEVFGNVNNGTVFLGTGSDSIFVYDDNAIAGAPTVRGIISGSTGDDTIRITGGNVQQNVDAGENDDVIIFWNQDAAHSANLTFTSNIIAGTHSDYVEIVGYDLSSTTVIGDTGNAAAANQGSDTIIVRGSASVTRIQGEGGNDSVRITNANVVGGGTAIDTGTGDDTILINGTSSITGSVFANTGADSIRLVDGSISGSLGVGDILNSTNTDSDTIDMQGGVVNEYVTGDDGSDLIMISGGVVGTADGDRDNGGIRGRAGNDTIIISGTALIHDNIFGADGEDSIVLSGGLIDNNAAVFAAAGNDTIRLSGGVSTGDIIGVDGEDFIEITSGSARNIFTGSTTQDNMFSDTVEMVGGTVIGIFGDDGVDVITIDQLGGGGTRVNASVTTNAGDDIVNFGGDSLIGGNLNTNEGADTVLMTGGSVNGLVDTGTGADDITLSSTDIVGNLIAGDGSDNIEINAGSANNVYTGTTASTTTTSDTLLMSGGVVQNVIGDNGIDNMAFAGGNVAVDVLTNGGQDEVLVGGIAVIGNRINTGNDNDRINVSGNAQINASGGVAIQGGNGNDVIEIQGGQIGGAVRGNNDADSFQLTGGNITAANSVFGDAGIDTINLAGTILSGNVFSGSENDILMMTAGSVGGVVRGDGGDDSMRFTGGIVSSGVFGDDGSNSGQDTIYVGGTADLRANVFGGGGADDIELNERGSVAVSVFGEAGNDVIEITREAFVGQDIDGGADDDVITLNGGIVTRQVLGGAGNDTLNLNSGFVGNNTFGIIDAGTEDDVININSGFGIPNVLNTGGDIDITGGSGFDTVNIRTANGRAIVEDQIVLTEIWNFDAVPGTSGFVEVSASTGTTIDTGGAGNVPLAGTEINFNSGEMHLEDATSDIRAATVTFAEGTVLSGIGTIISNTTTIAGAHNVGLSPGTQNIIGDTTYTSTASVIIEFDDLQAPLNEIRPDPNLADGFVNSPDRGIEFDAINITGDLTITDGATLNIAFLDDADLITSFALDQEFDIFEVTGDINFNQGFTLVTNSLADVSGFMLVWETYSRSNVYGIRLVNIISVPEPTTALLVTGGIFGAVRLRQRRKKTKG